MQRLISRQRKTLFSRRDKQWSVSTLLKLCFCVGLFGWCLSLFWISKHAASSSTSSSSNGGSIYNGVARPMELQYEIPLDLVSQHPVKVSERDYSRERITTKDGRVSLTSTEAFKEYGDEVRYLMHLMKDNLATGGTNTTLAARQRLKARAPWLRGDPTDPAWPYNTLPPQKEGKAIVLCAGNPQLHYLKNLIYSVRVDHGSQMPIRIVFLDEHDLTLEAQKQVESVIPEYIPKNILFINLSDYFDLKAVHLKGWDLKGYGLMAVPEYEVVFVDVDCMLLQDPLQMFQPKGYQDTGALFYHDRMMMKYFDFLYDPPTFAQAMQPNLSEQGQRLVHNAGLNNPYRAEHIQESGMMVLDKRRRMLGLWATCLIYGREDIRKYSQGYHMYGDKEMYWISFETIQEPYQFAKYYPGTIGGVASDFEFLNIASMPTDLPAEIGTKLDDANAQHMGLCGRLAHFDDHGVPLWSNGGYLTKEDDWPSTSAIGVYPLNPIWYVDGGDWTTEEFVPQVPMTLLERIWSWFGSSPSSLVMADTYNQWVQIRDNVPVNQYWRIQPEIGVNCLMANTRGIQQMPESAHAIALKSVKRYFLQELGKHVKYEKYF